MKKLHFIYSLMAALVLGVAFTSCSSSDDNSNDPNPDPISKVHYDLTVTVGNHGGMGQDKKGHITLSVASLSDPNATIDFSGKGERFRTTPWRASTRASISIRYLFLPTDSQSWNLSTTNCRWFRNRSLLSQSPSRHVTTLTLG